MVCLAGVLQAEQQQAQALSGDTSPLLCGVAESVVDRPTFWLWLGLTLQYVAANLCGDGLVPQQSLPVLLDTVRGVSAFGRLEPIMLRSRSTEGDCHVHKLLQVVTEALQMQMHMQMLRIRLGEA